MKDTLILIDGSSYLYRAYYALPKFTTAKGFPTNAIFGFVNMFKKLLREFEPKYIAVAFDMKAPTFRHKKFQAYKITRKPMPEALMRQVPVIKEIIKYYKVPIFELEGYEADDIMAAIAEQAKKRGFLVYLVTSDKDILQIIDDGIFIYNPQKNQLLDKQAVKERYGVDSERIADLLALMGDSIDNIPGIPGIGEKTAKDIISKYGGIENLIRIKDTLPSKLSEIISKNKELLELNLELARVKKDLPVKIDWEKLKIKKPEIGQLILTYEKLEFKSLTKELVKELTPVIDVKYLEVGDDNFYKLKEGLEKEKRFCFYLLGSLKGLDRICLHFGERNYIINSEVFYRNKDFFNQIFSNSYFLKISHNFKRSYQILKEEKIEISSPCFDIEIIAYLIDPSWNNFDLFKIGLKYFPQEYRELMNLIDFKEKDYKGLDFKEKNSLISLYCQYLEKLYHKLWDELEKNKLIKLYQEVEEPLIFVLAEMEYKGIKIDIDYLKKLSKEYEERTNKLMEEIFNISGKNFNINSPKQLSQILYKELKLKPLKKTKTGLSTDEESLRFLSQQHPLPNLILEYRELAKLKSTYIDSILNLVDKEDSKIHASFNQSVTQTGRLSSSNPNLQNIPIRSELGRAVRKAFIPSKNNYCFVSADYSQIELRILAHFSKDKRLSDAFLMGKDIHRHTAALIFGVNEDLVSEQMRSIAKTVNFGIIYGISGYGLSRQLDLPQEEAVKFIKNYFKLYPGVKSFIEKQIALARGTEVVETLMGRRRKIPEINSSDINLREFGERLAINTPIQGTAADIIKRAMVDIYKEIKENNWQANLLIQIHDELLFEVAKKEKEEFKKMVKDKMESVIKLTVPLKVNLKEGENWLEMK